MKADEGFVPGTLDELALHHARRGFAELRPEHTVEQALASIRSQTLDSAIVYFYVVDADRRLCGVVPTRRLLTAPPEAPIAELMTGASIALPMSATLRDAAATLVQHRLLAVPIVGQLGRMHGVIDAAALGIDISTGLTGQRLDELFQLIGVHITSASANGFRSRFSSLLWNVGGGLIAAFVAGAHEELLTTVAALALFMPVTLALSESIGMQAVAVALERRLRPVVALGRRPLVRSLVDESGVAARLAAACAALVAIVAAAWQQEWRFTATVLISITVAMTVAGVIGTVVPPLLHRLRRNPTVAAGPVVLALADFICLVVYFRVGTALLR